MSDRIGKTPPILAHKHHEEPSAFTPESLLREARRQKGAEAVAVPKVCLLDPDGDIVRQLRADGRARQHEGWVCYHTDMWVFDLDGEEIGVVGCAVGASFAVRVAEEMFVFRNGRSEVKHIFLIKIIGLTSIQARQGTRRACAADRHRAICRSQRPFPKSAFGATSPVSCFRPRSALGRHSMPGQ
ncbi:hypothetical protein [Devosia sp.]|uniref:hypothetical protein n=1 Tax=Devosia sp. TaxID=1871048 RepID=UPI00273772E6|nr:hypothetical protein [Devosia sp.]MDP2780950.1 hypothetical protein [Devosia sp.]